MKEAEQIMKRCQVGSRDYDEANNLHAECYRVIGKLLKTIEELESQEPVIDKSAATRIATSLGWSPQRTWVGLTDAEVEGYWDWEDFQTGAGRLTIFEMVRDIEAKLKERQS
jgi:hypothetical protein